jgi:hypothetical protein
MAAKKSVRAKRTVKAPVGKDGEAKEGVSCGKQCFCGWKLAAVALAVAVAIAIILISLPGEERSESGEIIQRSIAALENIETANMQGSMSVNIGGTGIMEGESASVDADIEMSIDIPNQKMYMKSIAKSQDPLLAGQMGAAEYYIIDGMAYSKMDLYGESLWVKEAAEWPSLDANGLDEALGFMEAEVLGSETKNGEDCYKIKVKPELRALMEGLLESQSDEIAAAGVSKTQIDEAVDMILESVKTMEFHVWIAKGSSLPVAFEGNMRVEVDLGKIYGMFASGRLVANVAINLAIDYSPVDIVLPDEAKGAMELDDLYDFEFPADDYLDPGYSFCGDGWCDWDEDAETCPEDCFCGDGWCDPTEDETSCPEDCDYGAYLNETAEL